MIKRVLAVVRYPLGGIRTHILYTYPPLLNTGYRFTFVGPADESFDFFRRSVDSWEGSEFVAAPVERGKCNLRSTVRRLLKSRKFDLIHSHGLTAGVHAILANLGIGCPHVITSHDVIRANQFPGALGRLKRIVLARILRRADVLITVSGDARDNHVEYLPGIERGRCALAMIPNGIDVRRFDNLAAIGPVGLRRQLGIGDDVCLMGFMGRFMEQKGFLVLVEALDRLLKRGCPRQFRLIAVGSGDYFREYRAEVVKRAPLDQCLIFLPAVGDILPMLIELDLLVMPSLWEAFGLLAAEAMCAGIPVIGSDCIGLREILRNSPSAASVAGDPQSLCEQIEKAMAAPWKERAENYRNTAKDRFDVRKSSEQLLTCFERCAGSRGTAANQAAYS